MKLRIRSLARGLEYHGEAIGKRQRYYVFSDGTYYLIMSLSPSKKNAGNFNLVPVRAVDRLHTRLRGRQGVTSKAVHAASRDRRTFPTALFVLNALYVLVATGRASVDRRHHSKELYFNVRL